MKQCSKDTHELLGSSISITIAHESAQKDAVKDAFTRAFSQCERIEKEFSRFLPNSQVSLLNKSIGKWKTISKELLLLIRFAGEIQKMTDGAFDITVCSILEGWGYDPLYSLQERFSGTTGSIEFRGEREVKISAPIDLGGIGKGYALDRMLLELKGFDDILLDAGGDIFVRGKNEEEKPWKVVFEHPTNISLAIGEVNADEMFLASSSPSRRAWRNRHHLVNPHEKMPAGDMQIVYIQGKKGLLVDAFSTSLFVMGFEKAKNLIPVLGVEAMIIGKDGKIFRSKGFCGTLYS